MVKVIGLVNALAKLHNFCLNESNHDIHNDIDFYRDENRLCRDIVYMQSTGCVTMDSSTEHEFLIPTQLTDIGNFGDDLP